MPDREGRRIGLRAGTVTGSSAGIGSHGGSTTAPPDNLAAIMRDATIIVGAGIRPAVKVHMTKPPRLVDHVTVTDPERQKREDLGESSEGGRGP